MNEQDPEQWYVTNGEWRMGPLAIEDVVEVLGRGHPPGSVHVWKPGQEQWRPAEQVAELVAARAGTGGPGRVTGAYAGMPPAAVARETSPETPWFVVGSGKLVLMCVVTFGIYEFYWFYQQWRHVQRREAIYPVVRSILAGLFCYGLFRRLREAASERRVGPGVSPVALTVLFLACNVISQMPQPWNFLALLQLLPLVAAQRTASAVALAEVPSADPNTRLSPLNWLAVAFTSLLVFLALLGLVLGPPQNAPKPGVKAPPAQVRAI